MASVKQRVQRGAKLLDRQMPGWHRKVKITELDMANGCRCVLGQLEGEYLHGLDLLGVDPNSADVVGFEATAPDFPGDEYWDLELAWKDQIRKRRQPK